MSIAHTDSSMRRRSTGTWRDLIAPVLPPLRRSWRLAGLTILSGWGKFMLPMGIPLLTGAVIDLLLAEDIAPADARARLFAYGGAMAAIAIGIVIASYYRSTLAARLIALIQYRIRTRLFHHIQHLSMGFFQQHHAGSLGSRVSSDINHAGVLVNQGLIQWAMDIPLFLVTTTTMIAIQPTLGLMTTALCLLSGIVIRRLGPPLRDQRRAIQEGQSGITGRAAEIFAGISVIKAFAGEPAARRRFRDSADRVRDLQWESAHLQGQFQASNFGLVIAIQFMVLFLGAWMILSDGALTVGTLVTSMLLIGFIQGAVQRLTDSIMHIQDGFAACQRINDILGVVPTPADRPDAGEPALHGNLRFDHVCFGYGDKRVIHDFDFAFEAGKSYALVGPSGSGKTTLAQLMLRFYDPSEGAVLIDGHPLPSVRSSHYRGQVAAVLQDPIIFSSSVADNIAFAHPDAPLATIEAAAEAAQAHEFIRELPDGYQTRVGERGASLSGGQRQRVAIARALMRDPRLLILDEATSALDTVTERQIQSVIDALHGTRTVVVIAHRLSTIRNVDEILVLDHGHLIEHGSYDDLLRRKGAFARLVAEQDAAAA